MTDTQVPPTPALLDRRDERLEAEAGFGGATRAFTRRIRSGELGALPVIVGLVIICTVFQVLNPVFLSSNNLVNLLFDSCSVGVISLGIVCVLMIGEIDLSVGSVSGLSSAILGVVWVNHGLPVLLAIVVALLAGAAIGYLYSLLFNRFGMPSFVATLAGLLAFLGLQLYLLGDAGSINLPFASGLVNFGQLYFIPTGVDYLLAALAAAGLFLSGYRTAARRRSSGLSARSNGLLVVRAVLVLAGLEFFVWYLDRDRGVPWMFGVFVGLVLVMNYGLTRTQWGRSMTAVGGNREAFFFYVM